MSRLPDDVAAYYGADVEDQRLARGAGALEFERTKELLARFLVPRSRIADVGGGTGRYAEWLVAEGHAVELIEPVLLHAERARWRASDPPQFGVHEADARTLPFPDGAFDAVLLLGPLYHLGERPERAEAVREARRVCREGGLVCAAAISRLAPLLDTIRRGRVSDGDVFANVQAETVGGRRVAAEQRQSPFPDAYFHLPGELESELEAAGLDVEGVFGIEGPGWLLADLDTQWEEETVRERLVWAARTFESDPHALALSAHLLGVAKVATRLGRRFPATSSSFAASIAVTSAGRSRTGTWATGAAVGASTANPVRKDG
jgi:SAM-dependent methyltransferase